MPTIEIDSQVMQVLEDRAISERMVFANPNGVLRKILKLDQPGMPDVIPELPIPNSSGLDGTGIVVLEGQSFNVHRRKKIGAQLLREHPELLCRKGYYSDIGVPYQKTTQFPVVLFDPSGYLKIAHDASMRSNPYIHVGKQISIPGGISSVPRYVSCGHLHE